MAETDAGWKNKLRAPFDAWKGVYQRRLAVHLAEQLGDARTVLDVGCHDGRMAAAVGREVANAECRGVVVAGAAGGKIRE